MEGYLKIAESYKQLWQERGDQFLESIPKYGSMRKVLVEVYYELCRKKKCIPLEDLPAEEKKELWSYAIKISKDHRQEFLIEVCKALHGLTVYVQL